MRTPLTAALLLGLSSFCAGQMAVAPAAPQPPRSAVAVTSAGSGSHTISGFVLSAATGSPLDRAEVTLSTPGPRGTQVAAVMTGEDGSFRFDSLQSGKYQLQASRRGYITAGYQEHEGFFTAVVVGTDLDTQGLRMRLYPDAIIGGVVTNEVGEPVGGASVALFRQDQTTGEQRILASGTDTTDDTGIYEFARLRPGTYFLSVTATPWYSFHPRPKTDDNGDPLPTDQQPPNTLDVAYPVIFYANATDSSAATPIPLTAGDHLQINFSLHAVPSLHIQVRLSGDSTRGLPPPQFAQDVFGTEQFVAMSGMTMTTGKNGQMVADIGGLPPGHYVVRQFGNGRGDSRASSVDLTSDQTFDLASLGGSTPVSGKLAMASGEKLPDRLSILLVPQQGRQFTGGTRVSQDGSFELPSVTEGTYQVQVNAPGSGDLSVVQMAVSGAEFQGNHLTVGSDPVLLAATIAKGVANITGYAKHGGKGVGGVMILLVPRDPNANRDLFRRDQSNSDGSFSLSRVVPGEYTLVAIEDGWDLDWARPEVDARYLAGGQKLEITADRKNVDLPAPVEVQPR